MHLVVWRLPPLLEVQAQQSLTLYLSLQIIRPRRRAIREITRRLLFQEKMEREETEEVRVYQWASTSKIRGDLKFKLSTTVPWIHQSCSKAIKIRQIIAWSILLQIITLQVICISQNSKRKPKKKKPNMRELRI